MDAQSLPLTGKPDWGTPINVSLLLTLIAGAIASIFSIADAVPKLNVAPGCKAAVAINKSIDLSEAQSYNNCTRDEDQARGELEKNWASRCVAESKESASASYIEVLTCIQISQDPSSKTLLRGTNKQIKQ
jgi:hypothetical protein